MKCAECQSLVQEYFDGELDQPTAKVVLVHLENCSSCGALLEQLSSEHRTYQRYDRELEVSQALWFKTRAQLAGESGRPELTLLRRSQIEFGRLLSLRFSVTASAALVALAIIVTVAVMKYLNTPEMPPQIAFSSETPPAPKRPTGETEVINEPVKNREAVDRGKGSEIKKSMVVGPGAELARRTSSAAKGTREPKTPGQLVREAEKKYLSAIALLTRDAQQRQSQFDPETRGKLDEALAAIDRTILSTRKAVQRNPNDPLAVQYMLAAYGKKVDVLKEMGSY
jgi:hypothetical protein